MADTSPERFVPPSEPWAARVQLPLHDGTVRLVAPHGAEWTAALADLRPATDAERGRYDGLTGRRRPAAGARS